MFSVHFERFVAPARPKAQIWRTIVGLVAIAAIYFVFVIAIFGLIWLFQQNESLTTAMEMAGAETPTGTVILLATFIGLGLGPILIVRLLHGRPAGTLFGRRTVVIRDFAKSAGVVFVIYTVLTLIWLLEFDAEPNLDLSIWLTFLPMALAGIVIQTGAEELVFRGYLQQQLAARFASPVVWLILPSLAFGAVHYDPTTAGANVWLVMAAAAAFGLVAADLTRVTGSLGAAWGFHFANNVIAILFISVKGSLPGLALYLTPYSIDDVTQLPWLVGADLATMVLAWWILRQILRR